MRDPRTVSAAAAVAERAAHRVKSMRRAALAEMAGALAVATMGDAARGGGAADDAAEADAEWQTFALVQRLWEGSGASRTGRALAWLEALAQGRASAVAGASHSFALSVRGGAWLRGGRGRAMVADMQQERTPRPCPRGRTRGRRTRLPSTRTATRR